jgi:aspartate carbamoyltransferase regulatory subunit
MALILKLLEEAKHEHTPEAVEGADYLINRLTCRNARCITQTEQELTQVFRIVERGMRIGRCLYCESKSLIPEEIEI